MSLVERTKVEDAKFLAVASYEIEFNSLMTIDAPYSDYFVCAVIIQAFSTNLHGLLGFKVKATAETNITPRRFYKSDSATVKQLLFRFGVVQIQEGLIIGWESSKWTYSDKRTDKYSFRTLAIDSTTTKFEGRVIVAESDELIDYLIRPNDPFCVSEKEDQTRIVRAAFYLIVVALILPALNLIL
ncbi:MAG: hypothetical protein EZS28_014229 [Streblomastix strix]|uniref:Uncharacterized protein n=1 Tax=Streblomastix strix TaxID=222440 RepID=A0A5J4W5P5_9EUKA|nr:MAG: hypothetical protein EZS28_014229 [Streblomastix strix]